MGDSGPPPALFDAFFLVFGLIWVVLIVTYGLGVAALISVARTPDAAFGPWWDNTKQSWILGLVIGFLLPFGALIAGIAWFTSGKGPRRRGSPFVGRPFWNSTPKPMPWPYGYPPTGGGAPPQGPPPPP